MARLVPSLILGASLAVATLAYGAETPPPAPGNEPLPAILAPSAQSQKSTPASASRSRAISPGVASILKSAMPVKYDPAAAKAAAEKAAAEPAPAAASPDAPANGIVRLDPMYVRERRPTIFKEYQIYSPQGLREIAFRRYITSEVDRALNRFTIPLFGISAYERAMAMYREDERLRNMADLDDTARFVSLTDPDAGMYIKRVAEKTYMRTSDFGWNGGRSGNTR